MPEDLDPRLVMPVRAQYQRVVDPILRGAEPRDGDWHVDRDAAIIDVFAARRDTLESLVGRHTAQDGQQGMVVVVGSRIWAIDVVSDPVLVAGLMPRLLRGYALDALGIRASAAVSREEAELALRRLARRPLQAQPTVGPERQRESHPPLRRAPRELSILRLDDGDAGVDDARR